MSTSVSERFGKYWLSRRIGEGGMATLFLGTAEGPDGFSKPCVVKRIRPVHSDKESFRRMLGQEARVAALLNHPNIVQVFDFGEVEGENYLTMEYVEGASLNHLCRQAREEGTALGWAPALTIGDGDRRRTRLHPQRRRAQREPNPTRSSRRVAQQHPRLRTWSDQTDRLRHRQNPPHARHYRIGNR